MPVIYLTGAPATGKSTLAKNLRLAFPGVLVFSYSEQLRALASSRMGDSEVFEETIRAESARLITPADVRALDERLVELVAEQRSAKTIVIDSHAVTKESFGFRVTGFTLDQLRSLSPDAIVCLYATSETLRARIANDPMGRPLVSLSEAQMHVFLQANLAIQYGVLLGRSVHLLDCSVSEEALLEHLAEVAFVRR